MQRFERGPLFIIVIVYEICNHVALTVAINSVHFNLIHIPFQRYISWWVFPWACLWADVSVPAASVSVQLYVCPGVWHGAHHSESGVSEHQWLCDKPMSKWWDLSGRDPGLYLSVPDHIQQRSVLFGGGGGKYYAIQIQIEADMREAQVVI